MARPEEVEHGNFHGKICFLQRYVEAIDHFVIGQERYDPTKSYAEGFNMRKYVIPKGARVKCVMVSRFGDCGITDDLNAERGYVARVPPEWLVIDDNQTP